MAIQSELTLRNDVGNEIQDRALSLKSVLPKSIGKRLRAQQYNKSYWILFGRCRNST